MVERRKIGLVFSNNENWIGGTYYILNLISACNLLPDEEKPQFVVFSGQIEKDRELLLGIQYPYLVFQLNDIPYHFFEKLINKIGRFFMGKNIIQKKYPPNTADVIFPYDFQIIFDDIPLKICWIPDFQEYFFRNYFSEAYFQTRRKQHLAIIKRKLPLVLSSRDSEKHFMEIYPQSENPVFILNFAVTHPDYDSLDIDSLKEKFGIEGDYFISPNQFWKHKNHQVVLEAVKRLKEQGQEVLVLFTGKEYDFRFPTYTQELKEYVTKNQLEKNILFLGFIDRREQLKLMKNAIAVIQPSLFEGWSTVVEDAKAMNQWLLLSNLHVHQEQVFENAFFFDPLEPNELKSHMERFLSNQSGAKKEYSYIRDRLDFATKFIKTCNKLYVEKKTH